MESWKRYKNWNVSSVKDMSEMFSNVGKSVEIFDLELTSWNDKVLKVISHGNFNLSVATKVIAPTWN